MPKYETVRRLWSVSQEKYIEPGEEIDLADEDAAVLLERDIIKPAEKKSSGSKTRSKKSQTEE